TQALQFFSPPTFDDPQLDRSAATLNTILLTMLGVGLLGLLVTSVGVYTSRFMSVLVAVVVVLFCYIVFKLGNLFIPSVLAPLVVFGLISYQAFVGTGINDLNVVGYAAGIGLASLLRGRRAALPATALAIASLTLLYVLEETGVLVTGLDSGDLDDLVVISLLITLSGVILYVLMGNLEATLADLRDLNNTLEDRIAKRTEDLRIAKERAEESDRMKSQFLASMSHELRTPLNSILTFNELIAMEAMGPVTDEQVDFLHKSIDSGRHLLALINDVLDITKLQSGMMQMHVEDGVDLRPEIDTAVDIGRTLLQDKPEIELTVHIATDLPTVRGDRRRIKQIMLNLVSNACKFTETGSVTVAAENRAGSFYFSVTDTGPGIPPDQHEIIFDPFVQTETGVKHAGGTGRGLLISKRLVEAHNGQLHLTSDTGKGATFTFSLPGEKAAADV
ncbi:MAG: sensor histidine kinase, partial [Anaerolineae bacterium]